VNGNEEEAAKVQAQGRDEGNLEFRINPQDEEALLEWEHVHNLTQDVIFIQQTLQAIQMESRVSGKRLKASNKCKISAHISRRKGKR